MAIKQEGGDYGKFWRKLQKQTKDLIKCLKCDLIFKRTKRIEGLGESWFSLNIKVVKLQDKNCKNKQKQKKYLSLNLKWEELM